MIRCWFLQKYEDSYFFKYRFDKEWYEIEIHRDKIHPRYRKISYGRCKMFFGKTWKIVNIHKKKKSNYREYKEMINWFISECQNQMPFKGKNNV